MQLMDKHYCPICGNIVPKSSNVCIHCATLIDRPTEEKPKAGGCLPALLLAVLVALVLAFLAC